MIFLMNNYRPIARLTFSYFLIFLLIYLCENVTFLIYPLVLISFPHLFLTIILFGHEGTHQNIHPNKKLNLFITRYFCHFPFFVSHSQYSFYHLSHHRFLGTAKDPDLYFYKSGYKSVGAFLKEALINLVTLQYVVKFIQYFNGLPTWLMGKKTDNYKNDYLAFLFFWTILIIFISYFNIWLPYLIYILIPNLILLPWVYLLNKYQHFAPAVLDNPYSANVKLNNSLLQHYLFPLNVNFHKTHHQSPSTPYYLLPEQELSNKDNILFSEFNSHIFNLNNESTD